MQVDTWLYWTTPLQAPTCAHAPLLMQVDAWLYWTRGEVSADVLVKQLRAMGPHWDRNNGSDHILVVTADTGRCEYDRGAQRDVLLRNAIMLQHYGR